MMPDDPGHRLRPLYDRLLMAYGPQGWWPGDTAFEVMVGAILTQNTAWTNVEKAIVNLQTAGALTPAGLLALSPAELANLIRPAGYFNVKARRLHALVELVTQHGGLDALFALDTASLRAQLLDVHGVGPETADCILLYAAERPAFVIDAYTRHILGRLGLAPSSARYHELQQLFVGHLPQDVPMFNEYHALIVRHGKERCRTRPVCDGCPLCADCDWRQRRRQNA
ncbi:MAG: endonuclease III domain-containing protein [Chloroflexi bacterium]|nr:endonuclease III domain-containing protein [Chloroflexota bacterium]MBU1750879.1 endonuclease III domain-containing protein [Chloroflexota bacterium]MBU1879147.1 endonuclease III domain-containing protein [Chloroflexota bacterium]